MSSYPQISAIVRGTVVHHTKHWRLYKCTSSRFPLFSVYRVYCVLASPISSKYNRVIHSICPNIFIVVLMMNHHCYGLYSTEYQTVSVNCVIQSASFHYCYIVKKVVENNQNNFLPRTGVGFQFPSSVYLTVAISVQELMYFRIYQIS